MAGAVLLTAPGDAQQPPSFGANAELVVIDLIATDDDGRLVSDLRAEEIEVLEDGQPQTLQFVRFVAVTGAAAQPAGSPGAPLVTAATAPVGALPTTGARLSLVVVVDLATLPFDLLAHTREAVVRMARSELEPGTRLMLVALDRGLQVRQPFTDDVARFAAAVEALTPSPGEGDSALSELVDQIENTCDGVTPGAVQNAVSLGRAYVENVRLGLQDTTEGIGALARYLAPLPGRKHVVLYSAGYPMQPASIAAAVVEGICAPPSGIPGRSVMQAGPSEAQTSLRVGAQVDSIGMLRSLVDEANRAQVSVYTVDARGLVGDAFPARSRVPTRLVRSGQAQAVAQRNVRAPQEILYSIADGTGAAASVNTNELARGMQAAARDASGYYLLAYAPPRGRKEGRYYPIELKLRRPGLHARYRRGYEWLSDAKRQQRALQAALRFPGIYAEDGLALEPSLEAGRLNVAVILPTRALVFREDAGLHRNELTLQGLLRDEKGRPVGDRYLFARTIEMKLPEARYADLRSRENVEVAAQAPAPKSGRYQLAVVLRHSGGRLASAAVELVVP